MTERPKSPREIASAETPIVFVIDDDESMRRALTNLFESVGLRVETFGSAPELLQRNLPDVPSCLVLGIRLPSISGLDFQVLLEKAAIHIIGRAPSLLRACERRRRARYASPGERSRSVNRDDASRLGGVGSVGTTGPSSAAFYLRRYELCPAAQRRVQNKREVTGQSERLLRAVDRLQSRERRRYL
jgi:hypothetical protein